MDYASRNTDLERRIDAYIKGHLTEEEAEQLWLELLKDPVYLDLLETELHVKSIIEQQAEPGRESTPSLLTGAFRKWTAAAAVVVILVAALYLLQIGENKTAQSLALPGINLAEHLASPDVVRASERSLAGADSLLHEGLKAALAGRIDNALSFYDRIITNYTINQPVAQAWFNVGIIRYNAGHFKDAVAAFDSVLQKTEREPVLKEKAFWFSGHAFIRLNQFENAREAIRNTYILDGIYREEASRLLEKLEQAAVNGK